VYQHSDLHFVRLLLISVLYQDFKIQNIVASCDVKFPIRLEGLAYSHGAFSSVSRMILCLFENLWCVHVSVILKSKLNDVNLLFLQYEPELFPGLIYRMKQPKIVLLIFVSGKIVLTGAKVAVLHGIYFCWLFLLYIWKTGTIFFPGERWDIHCLWKHISCTHRVQKSSAMVCTIFDKAKFAVG
jgi:hypothetical protein